MPELKTPHAEALMRSLTASGDISFHAVPHIVTAGTAAAAACCLAVRSSLACLSADP